MIQSFHARAQCNHRTRRSTCWLYFISSARITYSKTLRWTSWTSFCTFMWSNFFFFQSRWSGFTSLYQCFCHARVLRRGEAGSARGLGILSPDDLFCDQLHTGGRIFLTNPEHCVGCTRKGGWLEMTVERGMAFCSDCLSMLCFLSHFWLSKTRNNLILDSD